MECFLPFTDKSSISEKKPQQRFELYSQLQAASTTCN